MAGSRTLKLSILADIDDLKKNLAQGDQEIQGFGGKLEKFGKVAGAAFAAATAAAVAYAGKLAIDGVKAAIEDEAAQTRLANALKNTTNATDSQIAAVEDQILKMSMAFGVADDKLRPAFQRLATATGSMTEANKGLSLALDISAATQKSVEAVASALGKAYEGNTSALGRLGIGLSTAELKSQSLDETMGYLSETFAGAATANAKTLEGQMERLKVRFDETKETIGTGLLPIVQNLLAYFNDKFIPMLLLAKDKAIKPITDAFEANKEEMKALFEFGKKYLVPFFENTLVNAIGAAGKIIGGIITVVGKVIQGIETVVNGAITGINTVLKAWNAIPDWLKPGGDVALLKQVDFVKSGVSQNEVSTSNLPFGGGSVVSSVSTATTGSIAGFDTFTPKVEATTTGKVKTQKAEDYVMPMPSGKLKPAGADVTSDLGGFRMAENAGITINVNAPSVIDEAGFTKSIVDALNQATNRGTVGGAGIRSAVVAL